MQYDRRETDVELIRHLFTHEITAAENDSFQGFGDAFTLAAVLLANFRDPIDVPLFARAKLANFDTACGFPLEFMYIAGGDDTERTLKESNLELWNALSERFLDSNFAFNELDEWWTAVNKAYPDAKQDDDLLSHYEWSLAFDELEEARRCLDQWALEEPESDSKWSKLKYEYERLGDFRSAAVVAGSQLNAAAGAWDRASALRDLVKLHRCGKDFSLSLDAARQLDTNFKSFDDWIGVGLGRIAIHEVFELALSHPDLASACEAFDIADKWFRRSQDLAFVGLEAGEKAAIHCGRTEKAKRYKELACAERERIDAMLKGS